MRISVEFLFNHEAKPSAVSGVEGEVTDFILPSVGDLVRHSDSGAPFIGKVTERIFSYNLPEGSNIDGSVRVTLSLDRIVVQ